MAFSENNPHIRKDGLPIPGQARLALDFERNKELKKRESLSREEITTIEESENNWDKHMSIK